MFDLPPQRTSARRRVRARAALAGAVAAALAAIAATPALATPDPDEGFGYNVQSLVRAVDSGPPKFSPSQWPTYLGLMTRDGLKVARADALWRPAEPTAPVNGVHRYDWSTADGIAGGLAQQGVRWDAVLTGSPSWAGSVARNPFSSPTRDHFGDYAAFVAAFAARYGEGGSFWAAHPELPTLPVHKFEIWNEPNTQVHWGVTPDPAAYASLFTGAQAAIKAADPSADVLVGGIVWNDDVNYLNGLFGALGPGVAVDGLGSHPYAPTVFSLAANVVRVRAALDALGRQGVPLEINELGWPAAYDRAPTSHAVAGPVADVSRAATMALTVDALARSTCNISGVQIFDLVEAEDNPTQVESLMGLYRRDGSTTLTATAFAEAVARYRATQAAPGPPIPVCGARGAKATQVLALGLAAAPAKGGCTVATITYRGQPLEEAQVHVLSPYALTVASDANGRALLCPPAGTVLHAKVPIRVQADIPGVASSNVGSCLKGTCRVIGPAAACALSNLKISGSRRIALVLRRGLKITTAGCDPQIGVTTRVRTALTLSRAAARSAGIAARRKTISIATGTAKVAPAQRVAFRTRFTKTARRALKGRRRVTVTVQITVREGTTTDQTTQQVTLKR
jgi:hypothetical protein